MSQQARIAENLTSLRGHLTAKKQAGGRHAEVAGVIDAIALAGKALAHKVRRARVDDVLGEVGETNLHGEKQQKLDVIADQLLLQCLRERSDVALFASEEREDPVVLRPASDGGRFCVLVDPLDGSSNVDVAVSVGTIFSILPNDQSDETTERATLQPGSNQLAAGYILYGSSVVMLLTMGDGVDMFVLDPLVGDFLLVWEGLRIPDERKIYSINEAYVNDFDAGLRDYLEFAHGAGYSARYVGSMVADVHRTLIKGGVFLYPATRKAPEGKLRLMYEGNPMAFVVEQAGGAAAAGRGRILDVVPEHLHQRTPVILGSAAEVEQVTRRL
jgi:fructose-1,6-bisphosphatase I